MQTGPSMGPTLQNRESSGGLKTTPKRGNLGKDRDCGHALPKGIYITSVLHSKILDHMATGPHIFHANASARPQHGSRWPQNGCLFLEPFSGIQTPKCPECMARNIKYIIGIWTFSKKPFWVKHLKGTGGNHVALLVLVNPNRWTNSQTKWDVQVWQKAHYRTIIPSSTVSDNLLVTSNIEIPFHTPPTSCWVLRCFEILTETPNNAAAHPGSGWKMGKLRNRVGVLIVSVVLLILEPPGLHRHIQSISISVVAIQLLGYQFLMHTMHTL